MFNWRTKHDIDLPAPEAYCNFKVQVWNVNWKPDDCIAEAVIPLAGFMEFSRRKFEKAKDERKIDREQYITRIPRQYVHMQHPFNSDQVHSSKK